jgi:predicted HAD superfamily hydrolase
MYPLNSAWAKYSGRLYAKVLELEKLNPQDVVHVGDNFASDV